MQMIDVLKKLRELENPSEAVKMAIENTANLGEGKLDDLADARAEKEAAKDKKPEAKTDVKGKRYGGAAQKNDAPEKDDEDLDEGKLDDLADARAVADAAEAEEGEQRTDRMIKAIGKTDVKGKSYGGAKQKDDAEELDEDGPGAKWRQGYEATGHPPGMKHALGTGPVGGTYRNEPEGYDHDEKKHPINKYRDHKDPLNGREKGKLSTSGKPLLPKNAARNLKGDIKSSLGKHGPVNALPESTINELSPKTLSSYTNKASGATSFHGVQVADDDWYDEGGKDLTHTNGEPVATERTRAQKKQSFDILQKRHGGLKTAYKKLAAKKGVNEGAVKELYMDFLEALDTNQRIQRIALEGHGHFFDVQDAVERLLNTSEQYAHVGSSLRANLCAAGMKHLGFGNGPSDDEIGLNVSQDPYDLDDPAPGINQPMGEQTTGIPGSFNPDGSYNTSDDEANEFDEYEHMFNESMGNFMNADAVEHDMGQESKLNISTNQSSDGTKSITINAEGDQADALMQMLKMAGLEGRGGTDTEIEEPDQSSEIEIVDIHGDADAFPEEMDEEEEFANEPDPTVHTSTSQMMDRGTDLNRPKKQSYPLRARGDNPMTSEAKLWNEYSTLLKKVIKK